MEYFGVFDGLFGYYVLISFRSYGGILICLGFVINTMSEFRAALRKGVARLRQKRSTSREGRMLHTQAALEQLYQTFRANSRETSCLLPLASSHFCLCFCNGHG